MNQSYRYLKNLISNSSLIARLFTVIRTKQVISLIYHTFSNSESRAVEISPYLLKEYNNRWYLIAGACDTGKLLTFPLDRIDDFTPTLFAKYREPIEDINGPSRKLGAWIFGKVLNLRYDNK